MKPVLVCSGLLLAALGCGGGSRPSNVVPASGVVTLDGVPVEQATVIFVADVGTQHATAVTDATGTFKLQAFPDREGAVPGSYKVAVNKTVVDRSGGGVNVQYGLPEGYSSVLTSGLTSTIPQGGTTSLKIELTSPGPAPIATSAEPAAPEPAAAEPSVSEPATTEPATTEPATTEPATTEPATTEPAATEPATTAPALPETTPE